MKTTKILSTVALAALMAACSNEEWAVLDQGKVNNQDLSIRPLVENTAITVSSDAATRMNVPGKYRPGFVDGDKLGACLIDVPTYGSKKEYDDAMLIGTPAVSLYEVVEQIQTNYPYEMKDGAWYTQASLVEGSYMFYAPYNENNNKRYPVIAKLPAVQHVTSKTSAIEEFANSGDVVKVGYLFMNASSSMKPSVEMHDLFAYPLITVKNNFKGYLFGTRGLVHTMSEVIPTYYDGKVTLKSIQLFVTSDGNVKATADDVVEAPILFGDGTSKTNAALMSSDGLIANLRNDFGANSNVWYKNGYESAFTYDVLNTAADAQDVKKRKLLTTIELDEELAQEGETQFNIVLPAKVYAETLSARVIVEIEGKQYEINASTVEANTNWANNSWKLDITANADRTAAFSNTISNGVTLLKSLQYPAQEYNTDGSEKDIKGGLMTLELTGGVLAGWNSTTALAAPAGTANVQAAFEWNPEEPAAVGISNNEELIDWFKNTVRYADLEEVGAPSAISTEFNLTPDNTVTINAELITALNKYNFKYGAQAGTLKFASILPIASDVYVSEVANGTTANDKDVTFKTLDGKYYKINIPVATAGASITVNGNYLLSATAVTVVNSNLPLNPLKVVNLINLSSTTAVLNLTTAADAKYITSVNNLGTLTINNMDNSALRIFNNGTLELAASKKANSVIYNLAGKAMTNNGVMMSNAVNNGKITTGASSITKVGGGTGTIVNDNKAQVSVAAGATQDVTLTVASYSGQLNKGSNPSPAIPATAGINTLIVTGDVTAATVADITTPIVGSSVKEIQIGGTLTTNFEGPADLSNVTLNFKNGSATTWDGAATGTVITDCNVKTGVQITITNIDATGTKTGAGSIVAGDFASWTNK